MTAVGSNAYLVTSWPEDMASGYDSFAYAVCSADTLARRARTY